MRNKNNFIIRNIVRFINQMSIKVTNKKKINNLLNFIYTILMLILILIIIINIEHR